MSCRELDRLLAAGRQGDFESHRASCPSCGELAREMERFAEALGGLSRPSPRRALYESLYAIPRQTVSCEAAPELLARAAENEISVADAARLKSHL